MTLLLLLAACPSKDSGPPSVDAGDSGDSGDTGEPAIPQSDDCPPASEMSIETQAWNDEPASIDVTAFNGGWTGSEGEYDYSDTPGWEGVRFEVDRPACVYAVDVTWSIPPEDGAGIVGVFPDFGHNGFDFDQWTPDWTFTADDVTDNGDGTWTYTLPTPVYVEGPALFYVASWRAGDDGPTMAMDTTMVGEGTCAAWDDCHSALNYPGADAGTYYNGTSFPLPYEFGVTASFAYTTDPIADEDLWFHAVDIGTTSSQAAWGDYDDDGDDDLMVSGPVLWRNDGGTFTQVSAWSTSNSASGGVWGDYDNDGCLDFFGYNAGYTGYEVLLHNNCDGTFEDVIVASGINDFQADINCDANSEDESAATAGAAWIDFDLDGLLDLALAEHICWANVNGREQYYDDRFFHNEGDGTFTEWAEDHGFEDDDLATRGAVPVDADLDGDVDLMMNNYRLGRNFYYENLGGGAFEEVGRDNGLSGNNLAGSYYGHTIGVAWGDLDNDGDWDQVAGNLAHPRFYDFSDKTNILVNTDGTWVDEAAARGIEYHETHSNPALLDFENDGDLDLVITEVYDGRPTDVYTNDGTANFTKARREAGFWVENGWGTAVSDYDGDGDQDLMATYLYQNGVATGHWLQLRLVGDGTSNRAAIGAIAWVTSGGQTWMATVPGGSGTGNQDSLTLHFGLGDATTIDEVVVWYPGGATTTYTGLTADAGWRLYETGAVEAGLGAATAR